MKRIVADSGILGGKPVLENTRLSVEHILGLLAHRMTHAEIIAAYPELDEEDIYGVLEYAAAALGNDVVLDLGPPALR